MIIPHTLQQIILIQSLIIHRTVKGNFLLYESCSFITSTQTTDHEWEWTLLKKLTWQACYCEYWGDGVEVYRLCRLPIWYWNEKAQILFAVSTFYCYAFPIVLVCTTCALLNGSMVCEWMKNKPKAQRARG
jgi:hypothetical protein